MACHNSALKAEPRQNIIEKKYRPALKNHKLPILSGNWPPLAQKAKTATAKPQPPEGNFAKI
ncbi:hypothetical protein DPQ22_02490 [Candidatus Tokpelaia sp.]|nr:hypothetical protein DPQ22_02490 [Candidatus Tokpelaia sp.]